MLTLVFQEQKKPKYVLLLAFYTLFFLGIYTTLDYLGNDTYATMIQTFGYVTLILHIVVNIIISILTGLMMSLTTINLQLTKKEPKGSNTIPMASFFLGIFTFGCTGCVVAFLAAIGISFSPMILPMANLPWKLLALLIVSIGFLYIIRSIQNTTCEIKTPTE